MEWHIQYVGIVPSSLVSYYPPLSWFTIALPLVLGGSLNKGDKGEDDAEYAVNLLCLLIECFVDVDRNFNGFARRNDFDRFVD